MRLVFAGFVALFGASLPIRGQEAGHPGVSVYLSGRLLSSAFGHPEAKSTPVDVFHGKYHIRGLANLTGQVAFECLPCANEWRLQMLLYGQAHGCDSVQLRRLRVQTADLSTVCVRQEVFIGPEGIRAGTSSVSAPTRSRFLSADSGRPPVRDALVAHAARMQFRFLPAKGDRIATEVSEFVLRGEIEKDLPVMLDSANRQFRERVLTTLSDLDIPVDRARFSSSADGLQLGLIVPETRPAPEPASGGEDLRVCLHADVLNRLARQIFGGSTQIGKDLEAEVAQILAALGATQTANPSTQAWSISLNKQRPVEFQIRDDTIRLTINGDAFTFGGRDYPALSASIVYDVKSESGQPRAQRRVVEIHPSGKPASELTARENVVKGLLFLKISQMFVRELDLSQIQIPKVSDHARLSRVSAHNGWLSFEWVRTP